MIYRTCREAFGLVRASDYTTKRLRFGARLSRRREMLAEALVGLTELYQPLPELPMEAGCVLETLDRIGSPATTPIRNAAM